ncbi:MAG: ZIP family metal transporter, partial [Clostridia bacterium]|nr:ZIP family metal transporter [Clostridia bacterium]
MNIVWWIVIVTAIAGICGTGLGGLVGAILRRDSAKVVSLLLSFAGGVMMAVVCFDLIPESLLPEGA